MYVVMAAFMLVGAKLGDILGRDRAFGLGLAVRPVLITALSPNPHCAADRLVGYRGARRGAGDPAIAALTAANYDGRCPRSRTA